MLTATRQRTKREDYVKGLRELADFLEQTPDFPLPSATFTVHPLNSEVAETTHLLAPVSKRNNSETLAIQRRFSGVVLQARWWHGGICKRVKCGTETVQEWVSPKGGYYQTVQRDKYKYICPPLLASEKGDK